MVIKSMIDRKQMSGLVFVAGSLCIMFISCLPASSIPSSSVSFASMDLIVHSLMYGVLSHVFYRFLKDLFYPRQIGLASLILVVLVPFVYGVVIEALQGFVPGRHPSIWDALFNLIGSCLSLILIVLWAKVRTRQV